MSVTDCGKVVVTVDRCMTLMVNKMEHKLNSVNAMNNRHSLTMTQS